MTSSLASLLTRFADGDRLALARVMSVIENRRDGVTEILHTLYPQTGRAHRIGITGPPGAGKSSLTTRLTSELRMQNLTVGIVAVDPTSPYTGGAILGDRVRMQDVALDDGVFIRSMATRGSLGGLALTTEEVADALDAFGFDIVIMETVGVGQSELDIATAADTTMVVLVPESGDGIQVLKSGLMEIADIFVVNKSDRDGAMTLRRELEALVHLRPASEWNVPVLSTIAPSGEGVPELVETAQAHQRVLATSGGRDANARTRAESRVRHVVEDRLLRHTWSDASVQQLLDQGLDAMNKQQTSPYAVAFDILRSMSVELD